MPPPPSRAGRERGQSLSAFVAVVLVALFGVAGLVVDGGAQSAARARAHAGAAQAARAAVDAGATARAAGVGTDRGAQVAAAEAALAERGLTGTVEIRAESVHVVASTTVRPVFLSLVGITTLSASGQATAGLLP